MMYIFQQLSNYKNNAENTIFNNYLQKQLLFLIMHKLQSFWSIQRKSFWESLIVLNLPRLEIQEVRYILQDWQAKKQS